MKKNIACKQGQIWIYLIDEGYSDKISNYMKTPQDFIDNLPVERKEPVYQMHKTILDHLPAGFEAIINYGMIGYVVPHSIYPSGYHCNPELPLPFMGIGSQKNHISLYHMGLYSDKTLLNWYKDEYPKHCSTKLDMGKGCVRFKKIHQIPHNLIAQLTSKMSVEDWIAIYEREIKR